MEYGYAALGNITQIGTYGYLLKDFGEITSKILKTDFCSNYIKPELKETNCENKILSKGLETISVFILEKTRTMVNIDKEKQKTEASIKETLKSEYIENLGKKKN